ncbi:MAG: hypothetical protein ABI688_03885 [Bacteroidota bacterium]
MKKLIPVVLVFFSHCCFGQAGSEIFLFDLKISSGKVILFGGVNITNHKGYDNQPFFHPSTPILYFSSLNDSGRSDIKYYDYRKGGTTNLTFTAEREFSPTVTPDGKFISCIIQRDNGVQDLGKYPINNGRPVVLISNMKVGYHAWTANDKLLLYVLADSVTNNLHYYDLSTRKDTIIATNPGRSLHKIPGQEAMSFIQKNIGKDWLIKRFDLKTCAISNIVPALPGQENLVWLNNNIILMSSGDKLFSYHVGTDKDWQPVIIEGDIALLKGLSRLATNTTNTKLAVVVSE